MKYLKQKLKNYIDITDIITIHYFELTKDFDFPAEKHNFWELHYVDRGSAFSISDGRTFKLNQGEIIFHKPNSPHQLLVDKDNIPNVCVISFACASKAMSFFESKMFTLNSEQKFYLKSFLNEANTVFDIPHMQPTLNQLKRKKGTPFAGAQMLKIKLEILLIDILRSKTLTKNKANFYTFNEEYDDELVNQIITHLSNNLSESISLDDLSKRFNYSKSYLSAHFKKVTKKTLFGFFLEFKINTAKQIIRSSNDTPGLYQQISNDLGFYSPSHFFHQFKKITGFTPTEYSQSVKQYDKQKQ